MEAINPLFDRALTRFAEPVLILPSTCSTPPERPVPPVIGEIIAKLGLRYRPSGQADLQAHAEMLKLLAQDVADIPAPYLDAAAKRWSRESKFMPRASELIDMARNCAKLTVAGTDTGLAQLQAHCDTLNAKRMDWQWGVTGKAPDRRIERIR
jgi:hypothetical protein